MAIAIAVLSPTPGILSISDALAYAARLIDGLATTAEMADAQATLANVSSRLAWESEIEDQLDTVASLLAAP